MRLFFNDKPSSIEEICQFLSIKKSDIPVLNKVRTFKRLGFEGKRDVQTKKAIIPRGYGINNSIDVHLPDGNSGKITFAENVKTENVGGVSIINYTPLSTDLPGLELSIREDQKNLFFFLFIHPNNKQSPLNLGKPNPKLVYEFFDTEKEAREFERKEDELLDALTLLKGFGEKEVRQIAKGYKMDSVDSLSEAEVRRMLRAKLKENPAQFILNMEDNEIAIEGVIQDAIDRGVITERTVGMSKVWNLGDKELATSQIGSSPMPALRAEVESDLDLYFPLLQNGIGENIKASKLKTTEANKHFAGFKRSNNDAYDPLNQEERGVIQKAKLEDYEAEKYRKWYGVDVNDPSTNANTRKAVINNAAKILEQFAKDKAEGLIPEDAPDPKVNILETA